MIYSYDLLNAAGFEVYSSTAPYSTPEDAETAAKAKAAEHDAKAVRLVVINRGKAKTFNTVQL